MTHGETIRLKIIETGLEIWLEKSGKITSNDIALRLNMTQANILYHFKSVENLRNSIARHAVKVQNDAVILHLISIGHSSIADMSSDQRAACIQRAASRY